LYRIALGTKIAHFSADLRSTPNISTPCSSLLHSVMTNETSPLLPENRTTHCVEYGLPKKTELSTYDRFTPARKRMILALVSLAGMIPCESKSFFPAAYVTLGRWLTSPFLSGIPKVFVIGSFVPCIPQISRDLRTTGTVIK
jgi:hypothetical protein